VSRPSPGAGTTRRAPVAVDPVVVGLVVGYAADRLLGDPHRLHPVAGFGDVAGRLERWTWARRRGRGVVHEVVLVSAVLAGATALGRLPRALHPALVAVATWTVVGGRSLGREADAVARWLAHDDLDGARRQVRNLVGRDPWALDADGVARATVESVAENCADAVVAPLLWGAVAGIPGLLGYRAVNTLDAMVGHRTERYREFGWAAARLDDLANWLPARATVALTALVAAARTGSAAGIGRVLATVRRDAGQHPSPNAGPVEASWAAALDVQLGGRNSYEGHEEDRGLLGDGHPVTAADIRPATLLLRDVGLLALAGAVALRCAVRGAGRALRR
jgi:adenosylcobinamide-phosphate synthase